MEGIKVRDQKSAVSTTLAEEVIVANDETSSMATIDKDELIRIEFYKTYDVMTGIRIAATLGGFFSMMILLVLYKNYCKPSKTLSEEQLNAAVSAAVEEEDRALAAALEATSFYSSLRKQRESFGSGSAPSSQPRFSTSTGQMIRYPSEDDFCQHHECEGEDVLPEQDQLPDYYAYSYLSVPVDRRASSVTCSSGDTSYLERRGSAFEVGHPPLPCCMRGEKRTLPMSDEPYDFYYPIDIQVIQPTPQISPSGSEHTLYEEPGLRSIHGLQVPTFDRMHRLSVDRSEIGLAPLASISSLGSFSSTSSPFLSRAHRKMILEEDVKEDSVGSDSVFVEDMDTEDEVDEFETDSEIEDGFDDDYSFCETARRPISRCERQPRFASFDSCDTSVAADSEADVQGEIKGISRQSSRELNRQYSIQESVRTKRRLTKTNSEPRHIKQLPVWIERGRSGYVPKRQWSAPTRRKLATAQELVAETPPEIKEPQRTSIVEKSQRPQLPVPCSESSSDSPTLTHQEDGLKQGTLKELPSFDKHKRGRFQKQKTLGGLGTGLLAPPSITISSSCERLNNPMLFANDSTKGLVLQVEVTPDSENIQEEENLSTSIVDVDPRNIFDAVNNSEPISSQSDLSDLSLATEVIVPSRSSSQETLC